MIGLPKTLPAHERISGQMLFTLYLCFFKQKKQPGQF